jgi:hypothetical protein
MVVQVGALGNPGHGIGDYSASSVPKVLNAGPSC